LRAFALHSVAAGKSSGNRPSNHDLRGWHDVARQYGLPDYPSVAEDIDALSKLHFTRYTRHRQEQTDPIPDLSIIAESAADHLASAGFSGHFVQKFAGEKFASGTNVACYQKRRAP
jgi:hypothetical protein